MIGQQCNNNDNSMKPICSDCKGSFYFWLSRKAKKKEGVKEKMFLFITITTFNDNLTKKAISCGSALLPPPPFLFFENFIDLQQCFSTDGLSNISQCINGAIKEYFENKNLLNTVCTFNQLRIFCWKEEGNIGYKILPNYQTTKLPKFNSKIIGSGKKNGSRGDVVWKNRVAEWFGLRNADLELHPLSRSHKRTFELFLLNIIALTQNKIRIKTYCSFRP